MKRFLILLALCFLLLSGCSTEGNTKNDYVNVVFVSSDIVDELNGSWLFLPKEATLTRTKVEKAMLQVDFGGCEHAEITKYANEIFKHLYKNSTAVFDASSPFNIEKITSFKAAELDLNHADTAYAYYYVQNEKVYLLVIKYYGCGSGKYGNGKSSVTITDETATMYYLLKE